MLKYKINIKEEKIIIEIEEEKRECVFCGSKDVQINTIQRKKLNSKKYFYEIFDKEVEIKYKRMICKKCKRTFTTYYLREMKEELRERKEELQKKVLEEMFKKRILKYSELKEQEKRILTSEDIEYKNYRVLNRRKINVNQFDKKMIKVVLINLENFDIKELKYKEVIKKEWSIK